MAELNSFEIFQTYTNLIGHLAWPFTYLLTLWFFRKPLVGLAERITELKYGDLSMSFGEAARIAIGLAKAPDSESEIPRSRLKAYRMMQKEFVVTSNVNANGGYTVYGNGIIVAKLKILILANRSEQHLTFPISFVHEVTSVQFVGSLTPTVKSLRLQGMELSFTPQREDTMIEVIVTGL